MQVTICGEMTCLAEVCHLWLFFPLASSLTVVFADLDSAGADMIRERTTQLSLIIGLPRKLMQTYRCCHKKITCRCKTSLKNYNHLKIYIFSIYPIARITCYGHWAAQSPLFIAVTLCCLSSRGRSCTIYVVLDTAWRRSNVLTLIWVGNTE